MINLFKKKKDLLESLYVGILFVFLFLLPLFFSFYDYISFQFSKSLLIVFSVVVVFALFILIVLKRGSIVVPKKWMFLSLLAVPLVSLVSALLGSFPAHSLIGYGYETDTFMFTALFFVLIFLIMSAFRSANKILYAYLIFTLSLVIVFSFHVLRFIFGADFLSIGGNFGSITANTVGKWNDLAILAGVVAILSAILMNTVKSVVYVKVLLYVAFVLSLIMLAVVNFSLVWYVLGTFALISFVYSFSFGRKENPGISIPALLILALSAIFIIAGDSFGGIITSVLNINIIDARPLWSSTVEIARHSLSSVQNILLGTGPNTFMFEWAKYKPIGVNQTALWSTAFDYGISTLATSAITLGILGVLSWVSFLGFFLYEGFVTIFVRPVQNSLIHHIHLSSFVISLFLWIMLLLYVPGIVVMTLAFVFTGLFFASLLVSGSVEEKEISFISSPRIGFVVTLGLVFVFIASISLGYYTFQRVTSSVYYQKGLVAGNAEGDILKAGTMLTKAVRLSNNDLYYRALVDINLIELNQVLNSSEEASDALSNRIQQAFSITLQNAQNAIVANPLNYQNDIKLGDVYTSLVPLNAEGAYEKAAQAYEMAFAKDPKNPSIQLSFARLEIAHGDMDMARERILKAIELKNNYTEAIYLLSQLDVSLGNIDDAISAVEVTTILEPNNTALRFQLGLLYYNKENYTAAAASFERAVILAPEYANARYFLGLSYYEIERRKDAIAQFEIIEQSNPDNEEVKLILGNLKNGYSPFANAEAPITDTPEDRDSLPVEEDEEL